MFASLKALKCQSGTDSKLAEPDQAIKGRQPLTPTTTKRDKQKLARRISRWKMESFPSTENISQDSLAHPYPDISEGIKSSVTSVSIVRDDGSLGITLRGGMLKNNQFSTPVVITQLKQDGPAAREGTIKVGDRLLAVNGVCLKGATLAEAQALLKQPTPTTTLTVEYDVKVVNLKEGVPVLIEIEKINNEEIGIILLQSNGVVFVKNVKRGSLADRCGALHEGDEVVAINNIPVKGVTIDTINELLQAKILSFEVISQRSRPSQMQCNKTAHMYNSGAVTHCDKLHVTLSTNSRDFGLTLADAADASVIISSIQCDSPADRCGCLYPGDRVLAINHRSIALDMLTAKDATALLECTPNGCLALLVEFTVFDTVVPATGVFNVKLPKHGSSGLGLTISAGKGNEYFICDVKKGSSAHRAGSLLPGDRLLGVNGTSLDQCSAEEIIQILHHSNQITTLRVERSDSPQDSRCHRKVICTVELQRYGGPIGITIAGSEEPDQPINVSGLTPGGLAEQTGALMVGDEILAINNHNIIGEPLSTAHSLLQASPDLVSLKISRFIAPNERNISNMSPLQPPSVDSAVESWGSSHLDLTPSPDHLVSGIGSTNQPNQIKSLKNSHLLDQITNDNINIQRELEILSQEIGNASFNLDNDWNGDGSVNGNRESVRANSSFQLLDNICQLQHNERANNHYQETTNDNIKSKSRNSSDNNETHLEEPHIRSPGQVENFQFCNLLRNRQWNGLNASQPSIRSEFQSYDLLTVELKKDPVYEDFGFSVSDGLYERGVFINRIRKGGPADLSQTVLPFDRILQVNETCTQDFDCCLTVPLIATAGETLTVTLARANIHSVPAPCDLYLREPLEENQYNSSQHFSENSIKIVV